MVLFLTVSACYGVSPSEESYLKGVQYAAEGKFNNAKKEFETALKTDQSYVAARQSLKVTKDVIGGRITKQTAIYLFKGAIYANKGMIDEAAAEYNKAVNTNPNYAN